MKIYLNLFKLHKIYLFVTISFLLISLALIIHFKPNNVPKVSAQAGQNQVITIEGIRTEEGPGSGGHIDVISFHLGEAPQSNLKQLTLSPPSSGIFNPKEITITKLVDGSSPELMVACFAGKEYPEMVLKASKIQENGDEVHYYTIIFKNARITGCGVEGDQSKYPVESLAFNFEQIKLEFIPDEGTPIVRGWDTKTKKEIR